MTMLWVYLMSVGVVFWGLLAGMMENKPLEAWKMRHWAAIAALLIASVWPALFLYFLLFDKYIDKGRKP